MAAMAAARRRSGIVLPPLLVVACALLLMLYIVAAPVEASHNQQVSIRVLSAAASGNASSTSAHGQPYRTKFHFQPRKHWMNDPNGPLFYKGWYHLFYQYNPYASVWGNITWAHAVSKDLIHWRYLHTALKGDHWYDIKGVWSGSATFLDGTPVLLYTGWSNSSTQIQSMAVPEDPSDPLLREWDKSPHNPIAQAPPGYNSSEFRDPTTAWKGDDRVWRILVGANRGVGGKIGTALLYKSKDFSKWTFTGQLHSVPATGMWECPDFYPVPVSGSMLGLDTSAHGKHVKHVLKVSLDDKKHDYYSVGTYNTTSDTYTPEDANLDTGIGLRYDYGKFYASKTFFDQNKNRRILWGWANESDSALADIDKGWSSVQCLPRHIWLDSKTTTNLVQWPVKEVEDLRYNEVTKKDLKVAAGATMLWSGAKGAQLDIEVEFAMPVNTSHGEQSNELTAENGQVKCSQLVAGANLGGYGPFGLHVLATEDLKERTSLFFYIVKSGNRWKTLSCSDQSKSSLTTNLGVDLTTYGSTVHIHESDTGLSLRVIVDHSIVEAFAQGGRTVTTSRVYPKLAIGRSAHVFLFNHGSEEVVVTSISTWNMKSAMLKDF